MAHGVIEAMGITDEEEHAVTILNMLRNLGLVGLDCVWLDSVGFGWVRLGRSNN